MIEPGRRGKRAAVGSVLLVLILAIGLTVIGTRRTGPTSVSTTPGLFAPSEVIAFRARFDGPAAAPLFKWRAGVYSEYTGTSWSSGEVRRKRLDAKERIDLGIAGRETHTLAGREDFKITITSESFRGPTILGPNAVEGVDRAVDVLVTADGGYAAIEATDAAAQYTVSAYVPVWIASPGELTEADLRAAGASYPPALLATYTALPVGALGPAATRLLEDIRAAVPGGQNVYDLARTMETYLRDPGHFPYDEDVREPVAQRCRDMSTVECFATIRRGYCEYSASTMAALLRAAGVPARIAYGFLPGERDANGEEVVTAARAHWWVEVYFPRIGWFEFDPDSGPGEPLLLPSGAA